MEAISKPELDQSMLRVPTHVKRVLRSGELGTYDVLELMGKTVNASAEEVNKATKWVNEQGEILVEHDKSIVDKYNRIDEALNGNYARAEAERNASYQQKETQRNNTFLANETSRSASATAAAASASQAASSANSANSAASNSAASAASAASSLASMQETLEDLADNTTEASLIAEITARQSADNGLAGDIATETANRQSADTAINNSISTLSAKVDGLSGLSFKVLENKAAYDSMKELEQINENCVYFVK